jgi:hypothetical protein
MEEPTADEVRQIRVQLREMLAKMKEIDKRIEARKKQFEADRKATLEMLDYLEARLDAHVA